MFFSTLASLGAAVTLLALAMDPFVQQVSDARERWKIVGNGSLPILIRFTPAETRVFAPNVFGIANVIKTNNIFARVAPKFFFENGSQPLYGSSVVTSRNSLCQLFSS